MKIAPSPTLDSVIEELRKEHRIEIRPMTLPPDRRRIATGLFGLDRVLGGGLPVNRVSLIRGRQGSYKTTIALKAIKNYLDACVNCLAPTDVCGCGKPTPHDRICVFIDTEQALDGAYIRRLGIDPERIYLFQPTYGELACEYAEKLAKLPEVGAVVVDSLAMLIPNAQREAGYMDSFARGLRAKLITRMFQSLIGYLNQPLDEFPKLCICLNHLLDKIDGGKFQGEYSPGGDTQLYLSSVLIKMWKAGLSRNKQDEEEATEGVRRQELGWLVERSKVSRSNVAGELEIFVDPTPEAEPPFGTANDARSLIHWLGYADLADLTEKSITFLLESPGFEEIKGKTFGFKAFENFLFAHPKIDWRLKQEVIRRTFKDQ